MDLETVISGYCRAQDQARTVLVEFFRGEWDWNCDYPDCAYAPNCPIGKQIKTLQEEHP